MAKDTELDSVNTSTATNGNSLRKRTTRTKTMNGKSKLNSMSIEEQFKSAVTVIQGLPKNGAFQPSDQLKLKFYSYYKQATDGPNTTPKPSFYEIVNRYKWEAWTKLENMSKEEAMKNYVHELKQIVETMPYNESISDFYDKLEPFHEFQKENTRRTNGEISESRFNGKKQSTKDANFSSSGDSNSESDEDFSDTVDSLSINGDSKLNSSCSNENEFINRNQHFENDNKNCFEDCTDLNSKLQPNDVINAKGMDAGYMTGQENYFYDCIDKNAVLSPNDIICARGEIGIFSSRTSFATDREQSTTQSSHQPLNIDNEFRPPEDAYYQSAGGNGGDDPNYSNQHSELSDIHEHLALTVLRLQQTVKSISNRIENLETKLNERQVDNTKKEIKKQPWWSNRTTQTTVLLIIWPFAAHLIISAIKKRVNK